LTAETPLKRELGEYRKSLSGVIDLQIHLAPDIVQRANNENSFSKHAEEVGYYGWLSKCHHLTTAGRRELIRDSDKVHFFGSVALNNSMGGLNPYAVEVALKLGASEVWMPTLDAENHIKSFGQATLPTFKEVQGAKSVPCSAPKPISAINSSGQLKDEARAVIDMMAGSDAILGSGHLSLEETKKIIEYAKKAGLRNILITHPEFKATLFSKEQQKELVDDGAYLEHCATTNYDAKLIAENIRFVGASHCVLSSDAGQPQKGNPIDVLFDLMRDLENHGISTNELQRMTIDNPKKLLGL
jgi:hypothetical protein